MHALRTVLVGALTVVGVVVATGCGTMSIGRGPGDLDLVNDGSPEAQQALHRRYALAYIDGTLLRPGVSPEVVAGEVSEPVTEVGTAAYSDEATGYFATSLPADEATDTGTIAFDRFAHSSTPNTIIFASCVMVGAGLGAARQVDGGGIDVDLAVNMASGAVGGTFAGIVFSVPVNILYWWTMPLVSSAIAASDYRRGVKAFNADLTARILRGAPPVPPPHPDAPPTEPQADPQPVVPTPSDSGDAPPTP